jgi:hypothetical protein
MGQNLCAQDRAKGRDFIEEVRWCQTGHGTLRKHKKKRNPEGLRKIHQRRRVEETNLGAPEFSPNTREPPNYAAAFCAMQENFVRRILTAKNQPESLAQSRRRLLN